MKRTIVFAWVLIAMTDYTVQPVVKFMGVAECNAAMKVLEKEAKWGTRFACIWSSS